MNPNQTAALKNIEQAQTALKSDDKNAARQFAAQAAEMAPELEEVWLMMAALSAPRASMKHVERALQINPNSVRAQKGMAWAMENLRKAEAEKTATMLAAAPEPVEVVKAPRNRRAFWAAVVVLFLCLVCGVGVVFAGKPVLALVQGNAAVGMPFALPQNSTAVSSITAGNMTANNTTEDSTASFGQTGTVMLTISPTASFTPSMTLTAMPTYTASATFTASVTSTPTLTETPTSTATEEISPTPLPSDTPEPTAIPIPTQKFRAAATAAGSTGGSSSGVSGGKHWIDVDLTNQMVYAYEGDTIVNSFLVSTGAQPRLTVTGSYHVYERHYKGNMWGPGYFLPDVPYIMYFYKGYALHGTYWHANFGTPMSHGCVNLSIPDAEWLYNWSTLGTLVKVHY